MIYDGYDFDHLLVVEDIRRPMVAPIHANVDDDDGFDGGFEDESTLEPKIIEVDVGLVRPYQYLGIDGGFERLRRELGTLLFRRRYAKLVLRDAPDLYEMAKLDSSTDIEKFVYRRTITLKFVCHPASYGKTEAKAMDSGGVTKVDVGGNAETAPVITVHATGPFQVLLDDAVFDVLAEVTGDVIINACDHTVTADGEAIEFSAYSRFPGWEPGIHEIGCLSPFEVSWEERWR